MIGHQRSTTCTTTLFSDRTPFRSLLPICGPPADAEEGRAGPAGQRVGVEADDAAFEDDAGEQHCGQRLRIDALLAQIALAHLADDVALVEQVVERLALDDGEPAAIAGVLKCLDQDRPAALARSEERRVGKCVSTCRSRWSPSHNKKKQTKNN